MEQEKRPLCWVDAIVTVFVASLFAVAMAAGAFSGREAVIMTVGGLVGPVMACFSALCVVLMSEGQERMDFGTCLVRYLNYLFASVSLCALSVLFQISPWISMIGVIVLLAAVFLTTDPDSAGGAWMFCSGAFLIVSVWFFDGSQTAYQAARTRLMQPCYVLTQDPSAFSEDETKQLQRLYRVKPTIYDAKLSLLSAQNQRMQHRCDSVNTLVKERYEKAYARLCKKYGKPRKLTVKRVWFNGDSAPWTYDMYKNVSLVGTPGLWASRYTLDIEGQTLFTGDFRLTYANVVFEDNTYARFDIAENSKWLLVREGDVVLATYQPNYDPLLPPDSYDSPDETRYFSVNYVPQIKQ